MQQQQLQNAQFTRDNIPVLPGTEGSISPTNVMPRFYNAYRRNSEGQLVTVEMVELLIAGDPRNAPICKVTDYHRQTFPQHYQAFRANEEFTGDGTPIEAWGAITPDVARALRFMHIQTVEQLAEIGDASLGNMAGGRTLRDRARKYVELQGGNAEQNRIVAELEQAKARNEVLENQISDLASRLAAVEGQGGGLAAAVTVPQASGAEQPAPPAALQQSQGEGDKPLPAQELTQIKGVGPGAEQILNEMGIYRFDQVVTMTDEQAEEVNEKMGFPSRVQSQDWLGQAKRLAGG